MGLLQLLKLLEKQGALPVGGDEEAGAGRHGEGLHRGAVHQAGALELLGEETGAVALEPTDQLFVGKLLMIGDFGQTPLCGLSSRFDLFDPRAEYLDRLHSHQRSLFLLKSRCHPHHVLRRY